MADQQNPADPPAYRRSLGLAAPGPGPAAAEPGTRRGAVPAAFTELVEESLQNETGLTFFPNGQTLPAVVTKIIDGRTIEGRSQQFERIVIRLPRVNAIAKQ